MAVDYTPAIRDSAGADTGLKYHEKLELQYAHFAAAYDITGVVGAGDGR